MAHPPVIENSSSHTFQTFWWGDALSPYEKACLKSFVDHGHRVHLYTFEPRLDVPDGVILRDAAELIERDRFFTYESGAGKGSPAAFSNLFRYRLLAEKGGWWIDADVMCLSSVIPAFDQFFAFQDDALVNCAVMFFRPQHPVMIRCHARAEELGSSISWGDSGPHLLTRVLGDLGSLDAAHSPSVCYPIPYSQALDLLRPSEGDAIAQRMRSSLFLHLWNEQLRRGGIEKQFLPPPGSALRGLLDLHPVAGWTAEYDFAKLEHLWLNAELASCYAEIQRQKSIIDSMLSSTSWRWTAPIRFFAERFRALAKSPDA